MCLCVSVCVSVCGGVSLCPSVFLSCARFVCLSVRLQLQPELRKAAAQNANFSTVLMRTDAPTVCHGVEARWPLSRGRFFVSGELGPATWHSSWPTLKKQMHKAHKNCFTTKMS